MFWGEYSEYTKKNRKNEYLTLILCKSFKRLKDKTQVYIRTFGDYYRTRLTHTLKVSQIERTIDAGIGLN